MIILYRNRFFGKKFMYCVYIQWRVYLSSSIQSQVITGPCETEDDAALSFGFNY